MAKKYIMISQLPLLQIVSNEELITIQKPGQDLKKKTTHTNFIQLRNFCTYILKGIDLYCNSNGSYTEITVE